MDQESWIKDGTTSQAPVTESTPVETPVVETPAVEATANDAANAAPTTAGEAAAQAAAAGATPAEQQQAAQDFIEAQLDGKPFQLPKGVQIPWKRGNESGFEPIEEVQRRGMFERDYRIKTAQVAEQRREIEQQARINAARAAAIEKWNTEQAEAAARAYASPEDQARYEQFLDSYRNDPRFRKMVDDSRDARVMAAERDAIAELHTAEALQAEASAVAEAIDRIGAQYPGVDSSLIRERYARALQLDELPLSEQAIEYLYKQEAQNVSRYTAPLQTKIDALQAQMASLQAGQAASAHNDKTRTAIERATNPVAAPAGGNPPAPSAPALNLKGKTLPERSREWASLR